MMLWNLESTQEVMGRLFVGKGYPACPDVLFVPVSGVRRSRIHSAHSIRSSTSSTHYTRPSSFLRVVDFIDGFYQVSGGSLGSRKAQAEIEKV